MWSDRQLERHKDESVRDRYRGVLVGSAVGDALGATVEFMSPDEIRSAFGVHRDIVGGGWLSLAAGEVTDDTQMALCIARSIAGVGKFDPDDIASRFVEWYTSDPKDIGNTTRHALQQLAQGTHWSVAGETTHRALRPHDASNGSLMRIGPVPLVAPSDLSKTLRFAADSSRITHANPLCIESCRVTSAVIAAFLTRHETDPVDVVLSVTSSDQVVQAVQRATTSQANQLRASGYVLDTLEAALWAVVAHDTLQDAIVAAVNLGNDADTTGAVAGAIGGARWGMSAIPDHWLEVVQGVDELVALADRLFDLAYDNVPDGQEHGSTLSTGHAE